MNKIHLLLVVCLYINTSIQCGKKKNNNKKPFHCLLKRLNRLQKKKASLISQEAQMLAYLNQWAINTQHYEKAYTGYLDHKEKCNDAIHDTNVKLLGVKKDIQRHVQKKRKK